MSRPLTSGAGALLLTFAGLGSAELREARCPALPATSITQDDASDPAGEAWKRLLLPGIRQYCFECHSGKEPEGDLDLVRIASAADLGADPENWRRILQRLTLREMPPEGVARPSATEYKQWVRTLSDALSAVTGEAEANRASEVGRVTARRLNRVEYQNTIKDLLGLEFDARTFFPADDVGHGFDNIGDVLSMPPMLVEKYLAAAEEIAAAVIVDTDPKHPFLLEVAPAEITLEGGARCSDGETVFMYSSSQAFIDYGCLRDGEYLLRAKVAGQQAGEELVKLEARLDGQAGDVQEVAAVASSPEVHEFRIKAGRGRHQFGIAFVNDFYQPEHPDEHHRDRNCLVYWLSVEGPLDHQVFPEIHRRIISEQAAKSRSPLDFTRIVTRLAERAFRRPVKKSEVDRIKAAVDKSLGAEVAFEQRVRCALTSLLVSPHFLFRWELDPGNAESLPRELTDFELASRMSYFLWSSMPDEILFDAARRGDLRDPRKCSEQVERMLDDPRSIALARNFASQWLRIRNVEGLTPDRERFPGVDAALLSAMQEESALFFDAFLREEHSLWELLGADFTFANDVLARHYGIDDVAGGALRRVSPPAHRLGGILTQASVLAVTSNPTRTSPVKRGRWILDVLLDSPPPPPPPGADSLEDPAGALKAASLREQLERHRRKPECATCHARMDPLGLALENYDAVGRFREMDGDQPIDASAELPDGRRFVGALELITILKDDDAFLRSLTRHLATYAFGRGLRGGDAAWVENVVQALAQEPSLRNLVQEIVASVAFRIQGPEVNPGVEDSEEQR